MKIITVCRHEINPLILKVVLSLIELRVRNNRGSHVSIKHFHYNGGGRSDYGGSVNGYNSLRFRSSHLILLV